MGELTSGSAMSCGIRIVCGIATYGQLATVHRGWVQEGMCPLTLKVEAFGVSSSEISVLHQFLSVSSMHFLLTCSHLHLTTCI